MQKTKHGYYFLKLQQDRLRFEDNSSWTNERNCWWVHTWTFCLDCLVTNTEPPWMQTPAGLSQRNRRQVLCFSIKRNSPPARANCQAGARRWLNWGQSGQRQRHKLHCPRSRLSHQQPLESHWLHLSGLRLLLLFLFLFRIRRRPKWLSSKLTLMIGNIKKCFPNRGREFFLIRWPTSIVSQFNVLRSWQAYVKRRQSKWKDKQRHMRSPTQWQDGWTTNKYKPQTFRSKLWFDLVFSQKYVGAQSLKSHVTHVHSAS